MIQNLVWGRRLQPPLPLATGALAFAGITLSPAVGAILTSASTVVVALNAQLLRRLDLRRGGDSYGARRLEPSEPEVSHAG